MTTRARLRASAALALLVLLTVAGCSQLLGGRAEIRDRRKFIIEGEPLRLNLPLSERPYQYRVQVLRFELSRFYDRDQIIFRLSPEEIRDDPYNLWAVRPSEMVTNAVTDYLRQSRLFTDIREDFIDVVPDLTLRGNIDALERYDSGDRWFARLEVTLQLVDRQGGVFWQHRFNPSETEIYDPDMVYTIQALRGLLRQNMTEAIASLDRVLLIRKMQSEGRDVTGLDASAETVRAAAAAQDTTAQTARETEAYVIVPGKLAPEPGGAR